MTFRMMTMTIVLLSRMIASAEAPNTATDESPQWSMAVWQPATPDMVPHEFSHYGKFVSTSLRIGGGLVEVALPDGPTPVPRQAIVRWIQHAAEAIAGYYRRFPVERLTVVVLTGDKGRIDEGMNVDGRLIHIAVGQDATQSDLDNDWVMTHEMVHLSFPDLDERFLWMEEGLATYLEPIARARRHLLPVATVWTDLVEGLPKGQPEANDRGLDRTPTWGRTYWGGAGFWLLVDLRVREQTDNRKSLDDVLRGILAAGGNGSVHWSMKQVIDEAKRATGTDVVGELYRSMGATPIPIDLGRIWQQLGVVVESGNVRFDDHAPQAVFRLAITAPEPQ